MPVAGIGEVGGPVIFVSPHMSHPTAATLLLTIAEPTRLRIVNCLAAAPLFVSDLQAVLELPQPTVSRHLTVLRHADVVRDTPIGQFVLYRLRREGAQGRLLGAVLEGLAQDEPMQHERRRALDRSRERNQVVSRAS
jgi:ArsR family transcriptional regulator